MAYFEWEVNPTPVSIDTFGNTLLKLDRRITRHALLLPLIQWAKHKFAGDTPVTAPFGMITDDWEEMFADRSAQKPLFPLPTPPFDEHPMAE
jgi:hypothetical protein